MSTYANCAPKCGYFSAFPAHFMCKVLGAFIKPEDQIRRNSMDRKDNYGEMEDKLGDISLYGEFIPTFHYWVSSEEQKIRVQHLQALGRKSKFKYYH